MNQKGIAAILAPLIIVLLLIAVGAGLFFTGTIKNPFSSSPTPIPHSEADMTPLTTPPPAKASLEATTPGVASQSSNPNPFDDSQEDVNPLSSYQNPFDNLQ